MNTYDVKRVNFVNDYQKDHEYNKNILKKKIKKILKT
jgi:hypothetical protein